MKRVFISQFDAPSSIRDKILESLTWIGWDAIVKPGATIFIKPNLTYPYYKPGVTTSPEFMKAIVSILSTQSTNVIIGESDGGYNSWKAEEAFQGHQLYEIAEKHSAKVVNLSKLKSEYIETRVGSKKVKVELPSLLLHEIDVFITVPVPKLHCMTGVSLGFKNQWGCIPNTMRLRNHPEFNKKIVAINKLVRKDERLGMKMIYKEYYKGKSIKNILTKMPKYCIIFLL
jgi:uncharacterized protein (DUF362 family)